MPKHCCCCCRAAAADLAADALLLPCPRSSPQALRRGTCCSPAPAVALRHCGAAPAAAFPLLLLSGTAARRLVLPCSCFAVRRCGAARQPAQHSTTTRTPHPCTLVRDGEQLKCVWRALQDARMARTYLSFSGTSLAFHCLTCHVTAFPCGCALHAPLCGMKNGRGMAEGRCVAAFSASAPSSSRAGPVCGQHHTTTCVPHPCTHQLL